MPRLPLLLRLRLSCKEILFVKDSGKSDQFIKSKEFIYFVLQQYKHNYNQPNYFHPYGKTTLFRKFISAHRIMPEERLNFGEAYYGLNSLLRRRGGMIVSKE